MFFLQVTLPSQGVGHSSQSSSRSQQAAAESTPKHNIGNQEAHHHQTTPSPVKDSSHTKPAPPTNQSSTSDQLQHRLVQLEESLKEKAGFLPLQQSEEHSDTTPLKGQLSVSLHLEDSNKFVPSEELSVLAPEGGSVQYMTEEKELSSGRNQQQIAGDDSQSGMRTY